jgi:1-acyl-sn-glycerol-3-phosphate acyltransferase
MAIVGSYELLPMNSFHAIPGEVGLVIGAPIPTKGMRLRDTGKLAEQVRQEVAALYDSHAKWAAGDSAQEKTSKSKINSPETLSS